MLIVLLVALLLVLTVPVASASGGTYHTVRWGETLYSIGRYYGVNPNYIAQVNNLYNPNYIYAGQVLYIPSGWGYPGGDYYPCDGGSNHHVVQRGETLSSIAYRYGVSVWAIANANHITNINCIYTGQVLYIPTGTGGNCGCYQQPCDGGYYPSPPIYNPPMYPAPPIYDPPVAVPY